MNADFSLEIPSRSFPENFSFGPDIKIFRNGRSRAVRSTNRVPEIRKIWFSLWIPVSHLKSVQDHPWRCFTKTRSQDIWKRSVTGCPSAPGPVCHWDLCAKNRKNRFSLWIPVSHLESVQDHPWRCFTKTRSQDIWKRSVTGCPSAPGPVCHWDLCAKNRKNRFSLWIPVSRLESVQDRPWRCFMKTRSQDIQKRSVTDCPKGARTGVSLGLVREKSKKSVLSLDTRFSSEIRPGPSLVV